MTEFARVYKAQGRIKLISGDLIDTQFYNEDCSDYPGRSHCLGWSWRFDWQREMLCRKQGMPSWTFEGGRSAEGSASWGRGAEEEPCWTFSGLWVYYLFNKTIIAWLFTQTTFALVTLATSCTRRRRTGLELARLARARVVTWSPSKARMKLTSPLTWWTLMVSITEYLSQWNFCIILYYHTDLGRAFIGASDQASEGNFVWLNSRNAVAYPAWALLQPDNFFGQDCVALLDNGKLDDQGCEEEEAFLCEFAK